MGGDVGREAEIQAASLAGRWVDQFQNLFYHEI